MDLFRTEAFFVTTDPLVGRLLQSVPNVFDAVRQLPSYIEQVMEPAVLGEVEEGAWIESGNVRVEQGARIERGAIVRGPAIIGRNTVVRSGAYIRGHVMVGEGCLIGHGTEIRQTLIMEQSNIPHLNCFFTSIVGNRVRIGGCTHTANMRLNGEEVGVRISVEGESRYFPTGQILFGVVIGDDSNVGGVTLLQPGTVIGQRCLIHPQCSVSGYIPDDSIVRPTSALFEVVPRFAK
jgi:NDP-sugar pyrophosphorylase family protein